MTLALGIRTKNYAYGRKMGKKLVSDYPTFPINNLGNYQYFVDNNLPACAKPTSRPTQRPTRNPTLPPVTSPSCMSGNTRVEVETNDKNDRLAVMFRGDNEARQFKKIRDLIVGDEIQGLDENLKPATCTIQAVGHFGSGLVYGNYTKDHFILEKSGEVVLPHGTNGEEDVIDKYAVLTSCPVGVDESGLGFTAVDADLLGNEPLSWSDYVVIHNSIVNIVKEVGSFVFSPSTYTSMDKVKRYTKKLYRTMLRCARDQFSCDDFEMTAKDLLKNSMTRQARKKVKARLTNLGRADKRDSISAVVSRGRSVRD